MSNVTPGQPPAGMRTSDGSSSQRNSSPPAIHSAAVTTAYSATNASRRSAMGGVPTLLAPAQRVGSGEHGDRDHERRDRDGHTKDDRPAAIQQRGGRDQGDQPRDRSHHERRDHAAARRGTQRLETYIRRGTR